MPGIKRTEEYKRVKHLCLRFPLSTQWPDQVAHLKRLRKAIDELFSAQCVYEDDEE
jgi:hypothetical protein